MSSLLACVGTGERGIWSLWTVMLLRSSVSIRFYMLRLMERKEFMGLSRAVMRTRKWWRHYQHRYSVNRTLARYLLIKSKN